MKRKKVNGILPYYNYVRKNIPTLASAITQNRDKFQHIFKDWNKGSRNVLTEDWVVECAKLHKEKYGKYPREGKQYKDIKTLLPPYETWGKIVNCCKTGSRGLEKGRYLAVILEERFGVPNKSNQSKIIPEEVLKWADDHYDKTGEYPKQTSGKIFLCPERTWASVQIWFNRGRRGLEGYSGLSDFLEKHEKTLAKNRIKTKDLKEYDIIEWAKYEFKIHDKYPNNNWGEVSANSQETWSAIDTALLKQSRGLKTYPYNSLAKILAYHNLKPNMKNNPLNKEEIKKWIILHEEKTGNMPTEDTKDASILPNGEYWKKIDSNLRIGTRGLPKGLSLSKLKKEILEERKNDSKKKNS